MPFVPKSLKHKSVKTPVKLVKVKLTEKRKIGKRPAGIKSVS